MPSNECTAIVLLNHLCFGPWGLVLLLGLPKQPYFNSLFQKGHAEHVLSAKRCLFLSSPVVIKTCLWRNNTPCRMCRACFYWVKSGMFGCNDQWRNCLPQTTYLPFPACQTSFSVWSVICIVDETHCWICKSHKSHNAPVPYPIMYHSEQQSPDFYSEWFIVLGQVHCGICECGLSSADTSYIEYRLDIDPIQTQYFVLNGELWGVYCDYLVENWPCDNTAVHGKIKLLCNSWQISSSHICVRVNQLYKLMIHRVVEQHKRRWADSQMSSEWYNSRWTCNSK